jgi:hypothetical protein
LSLIERKEKKGVFFVSQGLPVGGVGGIVVEGKFPLFGGELVQYTWLSDEHVLACVNFFWQHFPFARLAGWLAGWLAG